MKYCPFCGKRFKKILTIKVDCTTCANCSRLVENNQKNKILSASWEVRKENILNLETLKIRIRDLDDESYNIINKLVIIKLYNHEELYKYLFMHQKNDA